ncbi:SH3 domain-containing protein [Robiginitalea myxolifaciens]|uniref:SH3 domain-containing protein n=1 Tax=Robiginitalea myxolifaciens TaxID=400055 RepID=A0A1I6G5A3_9FLAO|nr:tetratricopeptide repeat protein [Robiginitalea myxolifaciens]SFR37376.1 SH3 domain-containing protein [Robiginitalea myxolifaciens]
MRNLLFIALLICLVVPDSLRASQGDSNFEKATEAYNSGSYQEALGYYEEILKSGKHSAALYFNMGNAHYKLGDIAPSIYYFEKALLLDPADQEIKSNLAFAQNMTVDAIQPIPETEIGRAFRGLIGSLSMDQWAIVGIVLMSLFVIAYLLYFGLSQPNLKRISLIAGFFMLVLSLLSTAAAYLSYNAYLQDQPAIIFSEVVTVRAEPNDNASEAFLLHEGTKVQVLDSLTTWKKIELADGQTGWMPAEGLRQLKDF